MEKPAKILDKGKDQAPLKRQTLDVVRSINQNAEQPRRRNKPQADQGSISSQESISGPKALKIKSDEYRTSRHRDSNLEVQQLLWQQRPGDRSTSKSRQRQPNTVKQVWRLRQGDHSASNLGGRPFNLDQKRGILVLAGGGGPGDSSSKQPRETTPERSRRITQEFKDDSSHPFNRATEYLKGLSSVDYGHFSSHKHGFSNDEGRQIAEEYSRILNGESSEQQ